MIRPDCSSIRYSLNVFDDKGNILFSLDFPYGKYDLVIELVELYLRYGYDVDFVLHKKFIYVDESEVRQ